MSFLSLLDAASLLIGWGIIEEFFNVAPSDDGLSSKLLCLQFMLPKIIVDSTSANAKKLCSLCGRQKLFVFQRVIELLLLINSS